MSSRIYIPQLFVLFLIFFSIKLVNTKNTYCRNRFNKEDWIYCTKFGTPERGDVVIKTKAKLMMPFKNVDERINIEFGIYRDFTFEQIVGSNEKTCREKQDMALIKENIEVPTDGSWSEAKMTTFSNSMIPKIYFFVVADCDKNAHKKYSGLSKIEVEFDIVNLQSDGSKDHFSYEDIGLLRVNVFLFVIFSGLFAFTIYSYVQYGKMFERYDSPHFIIIMGLFLHLGGIFMQILHLYMYTTNGIGIPVFDIFSLIALVLSEITFSCLLIMIGNGWTITFKELDIDNNLDVYLPLTTIVVVIHLVLAALTYVDVDAYHKYHDYAGVQGFVLVLFKMCLFAYYMYIVMTTESQIPKRSHSFYRYFTLIGAAYMVAIPFTIFASYFFYPYQRQYFYTMTTNFVQLITSCLMLYQQTSRKSTYFKASLDAQGILPMEKLK